MQKLTQSEKNRLLEAARQSQNKKVLSSLSTTPHLYLVVSTEKTTPDKIMAVVKIG